MRKMNRLWLVALAAAMMITGALSEEYRTARAETIPMEEKAPTVEVAEGIDWDSTLEEVVGQLARNSVACRYAEEEGRMAARVSAEGMMISGYAADQMNMYFHDDELCVVSYRLESECSPLTFAMLDSEFQRLYGEASSRDISGFRFGGCSALWTDALGLDQSSDDVPWWQRATDWVGSLSGGSITGYREWTVGDRTRVVLAYSEANTFLGKDAMRVVFFNLHPNERYGAMTGAALDVLTGK